METENENRAAGGARYRVLYIEDNPADTAFVRNQVGGLPDFEVEYADALEAGLKRIREELFDLLLLDLNLPDGPGGLGTFERARAEIPKEIPIVVFTSIDDEALGLAAVKKGAQDYLVKEHTDGRILANALRFAMERGAEQGFFRSIVFNSEEPVVVVDWKGTVRWVNPAAEEAFGRGAEEWVGRVFGHPIDPDRPARIELPGGGSRELAVVETELDEEVYQIVYLRKPGPSAPRPGPADPLSS